MNIDITFHIKICIMYYMFQLCSHTSSTHTTPTSVCISLNIYWNQEIAQSRKKNYLKDTLKM